jgi:hypothetical protein
MFHPKIHADAHEIRLESVAERSCSEISGILGGMVNLNGFGEIDCAGGWEGAEAETPGRRFGGPEASSREVLQVAEILEPAAGVLIELEMMQADDVDLDAIDHRGETFRIALLEADAGD